MSSLVIHRLLKSTKTKIKTQTQKIFTVGLILSLLVGWLVPSSVFAATYSSGSVAIVVSEVSTTNNTYTLTLNGVSTARFKCAKIAFTTTNGSNILPTGMSVASATLSGTSTYMPTPASWTVDTTSAATGIVLLKYSSGETPASASNRTIVLGGITNGSTAGVINYAMVNTYDNTDCASSPKDNGSFGFTWTPASGQTINATIDPTLNFTVNTSTCSLGTLSTTATASCSHTILADTNAKFGYGISYSAGNSLINANGDTINPIGATMANSAIGTEQFGINLVANTTPSVGAAASGGSGAASANYNTANKFAFVTTGATVAASSVASLPTTYTVSYIVNISKTTAPGTYSGKVVYNIVGNF